MSDRLVAWIEFGAGVVTALTVVMMITLHLWTSIRDEEQHPLERFKRPRLRK